MKLKGINVPAVLAFSITSKCNLNCVGCYYKSQNRVQKQELSDEEIIRIIKEARDLGSRIIFLLGGEPFTSDVLKLTASFKDVLFFVFTNSTLITDEIIKGLKERPNLIPMLSLEGRMETDNRRGDGLLDNIKVLSANLKKEKVLYGLSYTVTQNNYHEIVNDDFIKSDINNGCSLFAFFEYIPLDDTTFDLKLTKEQKKHFENFVYNFKMTYNALIISPTLEILRSGKCLCGHEEIVHINSDGMLEPCPFIAYSDISVKNIPLSEALKSNFLRTIREKIPSMKSSDNHSCVLFSNSDWLKEQVDLSLEKGKNGHDCIQFTENELPKEEPPFKTVEYAVGENGTYIQKQTLGWEPKDIAQEFAWETMRKHLEKTKADVVYKKLSPLAYYMEVEQMTPKRLSGLIGISQRKIKQHLRPKKFESLRDTTINKYCEFFKISKDEFVNFID